MPICPYLFAALITNIDKFSLHKDAMGAAQCLESSCQMWAGKFIEGEGMIYDCGLKGEPRV